MIVTQQQQHSNMSNTNNNNNYINVNASNNSPILQNSLIINSNHQHVHQSNMNYNIISGGIQILNNDTQNTATFYQQRLQYNQQRVIIGSGVLGTADVGNEANNLISNASLGIHSTNALAHHMKSRNNRLMKNNGLNNNFYRSSGIYLVQKQHAFCISITLQPLRLI